MGKVRSFIVIASLAAGMTLATSAPANAIVCIDDSVFCCGTLYVTGKPIQIIPITC